MNIGIIKPSIAVWLFLATSSLQAWQLGDPGPVQTDRVIRGRSVIITWSEHNDELRGFSNTLGEWEILKIDKQDSIIPIVGTDVSAVRVADSIAAFSSVKGWWDVIPLSKDSAAQPTVSNDLVQIEDNGHLYTFANAKGRWTSPTDPELQPAVAVAEIKGMPKSMILAEGPFTKWLDSLPRYKARGIRVEFNSGGGFATIHTDRQSTLEEAKLKVSELLQSNEITVDEDSAEPPSEVDEVRPDIESRIARLRSELQTLDVSLRAGSEKIDPNNSKKDEEKQALQTRVEQAFDARQELQRLEAQRMRLKLQTIEANLDAREKNRDSIIQQRVNEFLDSNRKLTGRGAGDKTTPTTNSGMPATKTPIGLPGTPHLPDGGPAGLASHQVRISDARIQWPQPAEIAKDLRVHRANVVNRLRQLKRSQLSVEQWSKPLEQLKSDGVARPEISEDEKQSRLDSERRNFDSAEKVLADSQRDWNQAWSAYQSKLRLLRLDLEEAKLGYESLMAEHNRMRQLADKGAIPIRDVQKTESSLAVAGINVQRAEEMLKLYADIETQQPELNPDSLKGEK